MKNKKIKVGIIGTGNIGSDLLVKIQRSDVLTCALFIGKNPQSENIKRAASMGIRISHQSIKAIEENPDLCDIIFDATSAQVHATHAPILKKLRKFTIDLTPSGIGKMCIPLINIEEALAAPNVNMVSCGAQATIPIISALMNVHRETQYVEIVSSIASRSAGIGTRDNIDELTQSTSEAIKTFTNVPRAKTIIIFNPAEPPIHMHNTVYAKIENPKLDLLTAKVYAVVEKIKKYVPGYRLTLDPVYENDRLTVMTEVVGLGDFLPVFSGNLDIMNCAAIAVAEGYAHKKLLIS